MGDARYPSSASPRNLEQADLGRSKTCRLLWFIPRRRLTTLPKDSRSPCAFPEPTTTWCLRPEAVPTPAEGIRPFALLKRAPAAAQQPAAGNCALLHRAISRWPAGLSGAGGRLQMFTVHVWVLWGGWGGGGGVRLASFIRLLSRPWLFSTAEACTINPPSPFRSFTSDGRSQEKSSTRSQGPRTCPRQTTAACTLHTHTKHTAASRQHHKKKRLRYI